MLSTSSSDMPSAMGRRGQGPPLAPASPGTRGASVPAPAFPPKRATRSCASSLPQGSDWYDGQRRARRTCRWWWRPPAPRPPPARRGSPRGGGGTGARASWRTTLRAPAVPRSRSPAACWGRTGRRGQARGPLCSLTRSPGPGWRAPTARRRWRRASPPRRVHRAVDVDQRVRHLAARLVHHVVDVEAGVRHGRSRSAPACSARWRWRSRPGRATRAASRRWGS